MRIIAGIHRGRRLEAPAGLAVRPTGERAREALFDILAHGRFGAAPAFEDARVLDAFAGTGALGLEALSRGARFATFLERDRAARAALARNIAALGESARAAVLTADALHPPRATGPCDLVFLDPPYGEDLAAPALAALAAAGWVAADAIAVVELPAREAFAPPAGFIVADERRYGAARIVFLRYAVAPAPGQTAPRRYEKIVNTHIGRGSVRVRVLHGARSIGAPLFGEGVE
ncbi:MAG TPA: 16S rRNA (guanine(966)-N(2))-methyltransferase RsmD [Stellaceae bacterium]|nr:16S rRNA (guanine(966)-N(2))-methyltransferase RsmD [Stellaceae bacterium]